MTMDVYAQPQQRAERSHGEAFVRRARERLYGAIEDSEKEPDDASVERTLEDLVDEWRDDGEARQPASEYGSSMPWFVSRYVMASSLTRSAEPARP